MTTDRIAVNGKQNQWDAFQVYFLQESTVPTAVLFTEFPSLQLLENKCYIDPDKIMDWTEYVNEVTSKSQAREFDFNFDVKTVSWSDEMDAECPIGEEPAIESIATVQVLKCKIDREDSQHVNIILNALLEDKELYLQFWQGLSLPQKTYVENIGFAVSLVEIYHNLESNRMIVASSLVEFIKMQIQASHIEFAIQILEKLWEEKGLILLYVLINIRGIDLNYINKISPDRLSNILIDLSNHMCIKMAEEYFLELSANSGVFNNTKGLLCCSILGVDPRSIKMEESFIDAGIIYAAIESIINIILKLKCNKENVSEETNLIKILYFFLFLVKQNEQFATTIIPLIAKLINCKIFSLKNHSCIRRSLENMIVNLPKNKCVDILNYVYIGPCINIFNKFIKREKIRIILEIFLKIDKGLINYLNCGNGNTTLHLICMMKNKYCSQQMYDLMEPKNIWRVINLQNQHGNTPLMACIFYKRWELAIALIKNYADKIDFTLVNNKGNTLFSIVVNGTPEDDLLKCMRSHISKKTLLQMACVNNKEGVTARMIAGRKKMKKALALL